LILAVETRSNDPFIRDAIGVKLGHRRVSVRLRLRHVSCLVYLLVFLAIANVVIDTTTSNRRIP
jgi:hypothetical protein